MIHILLSTINIRSVVYTNLHPDIFTAWNIFKTPYLASSIDHTAHRAVLMYVYYSVCVAAMIVIKGLRIEASRQTSQGQLGSESKI